MNKLIVLLIALAVLAVNPVSFAGTYNGGSGTEALPYQINSPADWQELMTTSADWNKHFELTSNLYLGGLSVTPVGNQSTQFTGVFDGKEYVIRNAVINQPTSNLVGLFGYLGIGGQIRNLGVKEMDITGLNYIGGLVGLNYKGTITSCYATGAVSGTDHVGGLVGMNDCGAITASYATSTVSGYDDIGGLVGYNYNGTITDCYNIGAVSGTKHVGGLVGFNSGTVSSCYAMGVASGNSAVGGLVGDNYKGTITSCYATDVTSGNFAVGGLVGANSSPITSCYAMGAVSGTYGSVGGLVGMNYGTIMTSFWDIETTGHHGSSGGKGLSTEQMQTMSIFQNANWQAKGWGMQDTLDYPRLDWEGSSGTPIPPAQPIPINGSGTQNDPYQIETPADFAILSWHASVLDKHIKLMTDMDMSGVQLYPIGILGPFTGNFEGNGHVIRNAIINQPTSNHVGLFGWLGCDGQIRNLAVENVDIRGYSNVGGLVGFNNGTITDCYATGTIIGSEDVGGLVGENGYWESIAGTITSCYAIGAVSGSSYVGGLVGRNGNSLTPGGTISFCYATGEVSGSYAVSGLVGYNREGTITSCYAAGSVSGNDKVGGLVGRNHSGTVTSSFWDIETSNQATSAGGQGMTTEQMQTLATFTDAGWDFVGETTNGMEDTWQICELIAYPRLTWQVPAGDFVCPYGIAGEDLAYFVEYWLMVSHDGFVLADLNNDGDVDLIDFAAFAENWLVGVE